MLAKALALMNECKTRYEMYPLLGKERVCPGGTALLYNNRPYHKLMVSWEAGSESGPVHKSMLRQF